ncbi:hypothetical protein VTP01DRAFT_5120 [Rhizomucor pusillus]|uniref:uncharacterized protein n=1 Tax=Rhizomucor pusillus TaxID=4840 RepID=UPI0037425CED
MEIAIIAGAVAMQVISNDSMRITRQPKFAEHMVSGRDVVEHRHTLPQTRDQGRIQCLIFVAKMETSTFHYHSHHLNLFNLFGKKATLLHATSIKTSMLTTMSLYFLPSVSRWMKPLIVANAIHGAYSFRISGRVSHRIGPMLPENGQTLPFAQISTLMH